MSDHARKLAALELRIRELEVRAEERQNALSLQADEYERRLGTLNNEAARIANVLAKSVSQDRFDDYVASERARQEEFSRTTGASTQAALDGIKEKHDEFARRYEDRQKEVDSTLWGQAAVQAAASKQFSRNVAIVTIVLAVVVILVNVATTLL